MSENQPTLTPPEIKAILALISRVTGTVADVAFLEKLAAAKPKLEAMLQNPPTEKAAQKK